MTVSARPEPRTFRHHDALFAPIDKAQLNEYRRRLEKVWVNRPTGRRMAEFVVGIVMRTFLVLAVIVLPSFIAIVLAVFAGIYGEIVPTVICGAIGLGILFGGGIPLVRWAVRRIGYEWSQRGGWAHWFRLDRMGADNKLAYLPGAHVSNQTGTLFQVFPKGVYSDLFISGIAPALTIGNYQPRIAESQRVAPHGWGFLQLQLDTFVPNLLLIPRQKATLAINPRSGQRLSLEGDFDKHFTLFAPREYAIDALYVITPDLMALLIDELPGAHVEVVDRQLVIFVPRPWEFTNPVTWYRLERLLATVGAKTLRQTARYDDYRHPERGVVADGGRRLKLGISIISLLAIGYVVMQVIRLIINLST
jgi:hypothetical protein